MVLPFSSACLSYAWAITCGGWPYSFLLRTSSLVVPACVCGSFLRRRSCVFLLSSCFVRGRRLLSLLLGFASLPLPAAPAVFRGVPCRRLPLGGYATFLAPDACPAPAVELCLWGLRCLWCGAWFSALCRALPPAPGVLRSFPCRRLPLGVSAFSGPVCLTSCCAGGVGWVAALPLCSQYIYTGWLAEVHWVLLLVTGSSHGGCDCSL